MRDLEYCKSIGASSFLFSRALIALYEAMCAAMRLGSVNGFVAAGGLAEASMHSRSVTVLQATQ